MTTYVATVNYQQTTPIHAHPFRRPFNSLGPVGANMYSYSFSITAPATIDIESPVCVKMMMIAFIQVTIKSGLVPLIEGLCAQIYYFRFEIISGFAFTSFVFLFRKKNMLKEKTVSPRSHPAS